MGLMDKFANPELFDSLSFGDKMIGSTITLIMGMGITVVVLIVLWGFVAVMGKAMGAASKKGDKAPAKAEAVATPSVAAAPVTPAAPAAGNDAAVIAAVIAAAVAAYEGSGGTGNLVVRKISRISGETTPWSLAAKEDCIESRKF
ncbi:MAG: OadG family protein [Bacillota bacterium]|nr:OadG family protein [Bacillota bacterium]